MSSLNVKGLSLHYGGIEAVKSVDLELHSGELVALIGANGAGKTSTLKAIAGLLPVERGEITLNGHDLLKEPVYRRSALGLALVPEGRGVFPRMSVLENLMMGAFSRQDPQIHDDLKRVYDYFPRLKERENQKAGTLSGGEQQMLAMGRALMSRPHILLLDEPSMGLAPLMVQAIFAVIREISKSGVSILLVEQNARLALKTAERAYVMESGAIIFADRSAACLQNPRVQMAYLGQDGARS